MYIPRAPAYVSRGLARPEVGQVAKSDGIEPEYVVQCMVQTERDQQSVKECIDTCSKNAKALDSFAKCDQRAEYDRPYEQKNNGYNNGNNACHDGYTAFAAEERQPVRKLCVLELIVAHGSDDTCDDTDERVRDLIECQCSILGKCSDNGNVCCCQQVCHHQPGCKGCKTAGSVVVFRHTHTDTDGKKDRHVVDKGAACFNQIVTDLLSDSGYISALHG